MHAVVATVRIEDPSLARAALAELRTDLVPSRIAITAKAAAAIAGARRSIVMGRKTRVDPVAAGTWADSLMGRI